MIGWPKRQTLVGVIIALPFFSSHNIPVKIQIILGLPYFGLNFIRLKVKQEPKSREYNVCKRLDFPRFPGRYGGVEGGVENC